MVELRSTLRRVAATDATVLLTGETGTGKGLVARELHRASQRAREPFVHVDCASLATSVIESELFGHERGAFTGADSARAGRLESAATGTLFLDEVGELEPRLQAKLLRALEDRAFERVGGTQTLKLRARVVAATNRDLPHAVAEGGFRADLYYRLQVVELELTPLRERLEDLPELVDHGLRESARRQGRSAPRVVDGFLAALAAHDWPGNVRELLNVLERILAHGAGPLLGPDDLRGLLGPWRAGLPPVDPDRVRDVSPIDRGPGPASETERDDRDRIVTALVATGGNIARAARRLGLPRTTLRHRIAKHGLGQLIPRD
jgi:DNA-binding NtrC family response regulator